MRYRSDVLVISVTGEVDLSAEPALAEALDADDARVLIVDLTNVAFLAVTGLRLLIAANDRAIAAGGGLGVVAHDRTALRLLRMGQAALPVFPSLSDAIRELAGPAVVLT
ncbi:STAS domain-containing protein [Actinokineospora soli]|uniref:STAS domain-containing protein n=1 Tax=Actinokineospora soli TaxID=1048753 RepID=A0ABW2TTR0_9PSEU